MEKTSFEILAATPLPVGYDAGQIYLRTFLLNLRARIDQLPLERDALLNKRVYGFMQNERPGIKPNSRAVKASLLVKAIA